MKEELSPEVQKKAQKKFEQICEFLKSPKGKKTIWVTDLCAWMLMSKQLFYDYFPVDSDHFDRIKELLEHNRINLHTSTTDNLIMQSDSGNTVATIYLNKMTSSKEQKEHMAQQEKQIDQAPPTIPDLNFVERKKD